MEKVITFGCRLNSQESVIIKNILADLTLKDTIVINSCAVTNEAVRKVNQTIRSIHKKSPHTKIIVTGCAAQLTPKVYSAMPGVTQVLGNVEKLKKESYLQAESILISDINKVETLKLPTVSNFTTKCRAFVQIQNGCNHDCTFCVTTIARGKNRSLEINKIVTQVQQLVEYGHKEIVFTGVDITDYGKDLYGEPSLGLLIKRVLQMAPSLPRLRLSSLDIAEIDAQTLDIIISEPRLMPHLHLSIQSGDNLILKRMKRRHTREQVLNFCSYISSKRPTIVFGADIITGFPTENDEMFENTVNLIKETNIIHLHVFPYSEKQGTKAAQMPQVPKNIRRERAKILLDLQKSLTAAFHIKQIGVKQTVLIEDNNIGYTENFNLLKVEGANIPYNSLVEVFPTSISSKYLIAEHID